MRSRTRYRPTTFGLALGLALALCAATGCYPEQVDYGEICVSSEAAENGQYRLLVDANSADCASDHRGATFECSVDVDGSTVTVETRFRDGKDPNDGCFYGLKAQCEVELDAGDYHVVFADDDVAFDVPNSAAICLPGGYSPGETGQ